MGQLPFGETGKSANLIFYFRGAYSYAKCNIVIAGREVNLGDGDGMQILSLLKIVSKK